MKKLILMFAVFALTMADAQNETDKLPQAVVPPDKRPQLWEFGNRTDYERKYPRPTITAIGPFDVMVGRAPRIHVHIQDRAMHYVCSLSSDAQLKANGLQLGANVDIREQGKYLYLKVRGEKHRKWLKLRLLDKSVLVNL